MDPVPSPTPSARGGIVGELKGIVRSLQRVVRDAAPGQASGDEARQIVGLFAEVERAASSGLSLFTPVVVATGSFTKEGHGSAAQWLGSLSGSSEASAKGRLAAAERAASTPVLTEALHNGDLSAAQLNVVTRTSAEVSDAAANLLPLAQGGASLQELSDAAARLRAGARQRENERARRDRVQAHRHFRWRQVDSGGIRGDFFCDEVQWAKVAPLLEATAKARWKAAGSHDVASFEAHRLDAFIELMALSDGGGSGRSPKGPRVETLVLIDAAALRRGTTEGGEVCEIEGIGPVSVAAATELLGEGGLRYLAKGLRHQDGDQSDPQHRLVHRCGTHRPGPDLLRRALRQAPRARTRPCPRPRRRRAKRTGQLGAPVPRTPCTQDLWGLEDRRRAGQLEMGRPGKSQECGRHFPGPQAGHSQGEGERRGQGQDNSAQGPEQPSAGLSGKRGQPVRQKSRPQGIGLFSHSQRRATSTSRAARSPELSNT